MVHDREDSNFIGKTLKQRYHIQAAISSGAFGCTYKALTLDKKPFLVVVKRLHNMGLEAKRLFEQEAKILEILGQHPQIPTFIDSFEEDGQYYLVQEFIDGKTLEEEVNKIARNKNLKEREEQIFNLLTEILEVLEVVHNENYQVQKSVIHRDIKPANIMRRKEDGKIVLIDFGAVKEIINSISGSSTILIGSQGYMPSEQIKGKPKRSSDIFALGMIAFKALTGKDPIKYQSLPSLEWTLPRYSHTEKINWEALGLDINLIRNLADIISKMTFLESDKRYQKVSEVMEDLDVLLAPNYEIKPKYRALKSYFELKKFKEADRETARLILESVHREDEGFIRIEDIERITAEDLITINKLWLRYSNGKFGFSRQYEIWREIRANLTADIGETISEKIIYEKFIKQVGWNLKIYDLVLYNKIKFTIDAPPGHLPIGIVGINPFILVKRYFQGFGLQKTTAFVKRFARDLD